MKNEETKFYHFNQNSSGGYFVTDLQNGVCEDVIIEATSPENAWGRLLSIGEKVNGMFEYCECCGERWSSWFSKEDGTDIPEMYGTPLTEQKKEIFRSMAFVHYLDGTKKQFIFPEK